MINESLSVELNNPPPAHDTTANLKWQSALSSSRWRAVTSPRRRFDRTVGFWLAGVIWGIGGCILGGYMPYSHPVGITMSVIWWGIFFGCFGASIGALAGLWAERSPAPLPKTLRTEAPEEPDEWAVPELAALIDPATP
jgi:hypothetical protein